MMLRALGQALLLAFSLTACTPFFPLAEVSRQTDQANLRAPVQVSIGGFKPKVATAGYAVQALTLYELKTARVTIAGPGIDVEPSLDIPLTDGIGVAIIPSVQLGKIRIVTAVGLDEHGAAIDGAVLRDVIEVKPEDELPGAENVANLIWTSTAAGNIFHEMYALQQDDEDIDVEDHAINDVKALVTQYVINSLADYHLKHPSLLNAGLIATSVLLNKTLPAPHKNYLRKNYALSLQVRGLPVGARFDAWVSDPSSPAILQEVDGTYPIPNVLEGGWKLHIKSSDFGDIVYPVTVSTASDKTFVVDFSAPVTNSVNYQNGDGTDAPLAPAGWAADPNSYVITKKP
jgi:hypothetical protein